jgi:hypothetical protein
MLRASSVAFAVVIAGCRGDVNHSCPKGTTARTTEGRRICLLPDRITVHGPVVQIEQGVERLVGHVKRGKREGWWRDSILGIEQEMFFKDGKVDGLYRARDAKHTLLEWNFRDGHSHGKRTEWELDGTLKSVAYFNRGRPTGTWERHEGGKIEQRTYSDDGRLIALDGHAVPAPPAEISLPDGSKLTWSECMQRTEAFAWDGFHLDQMPKCLEPFERLQTQGLADQGTPQ